MDALGSVLALTDNSGAVTSFFDLDAWGDTLTSSGGSVPGGMSFRFIGGLGVQYDMLTGQHYVRNRWYDGNVARFSSLDLLRNLNRYAYVSNRPSQLVDPIGLQGVPPGSVGILGPASMPPSTLPPWDPTDPVSDCEHRAWIKYFGCRTGSLVMLVPGAYNTAASIAVGAAKGTLVGGIVAVGAGILFTVTPGGLVAITVGGAILGGAGGGASGKAQLDYAKEAKDLECIRQYWQDICACH